LASFKNIYNIYLTLIIYFSLFFLGKFNFLGITNPKTSARGQFHLAAKFQDDIYIILSQKLLQNRPFSFLIITKHKSRQQPS